MRVRWAVQRNSSGSPNWLEEDAILRAEPRSKLPGGYSARAAAEPSTVSLVSERREHETSLKRRISRYGTGRDRDTQCRYGVGCPR